MTSRTGPAIPATAADNPYGPLFDAIGRGTLAHELLALLDRVCGADSVHFFRLDSVRPDILSGVSLGGQRLAQAQAQHYLDGGYWRGDREMDECSRIDPTQSLLCRMDTREAPTSALRDFYRERQLVERLMFCGRTSLGIVGFSVMRAAPRGLTASDNLPGIADVCSRAFPIVAKHLEVVGQSRRMIESLTSLPLIEAQLGQMGLPRRELQVGARLLYGLSASCIAADLGIGTETVNTHRKRLYDRLGIGCHHELLIWYLRHYAGAVDEEALPPISAS